MYYLILLLLFFVCPAVSIALDSLVFAGAFSWPLAAKWLVFWIGGVRLLLAGFSQILNPRYTSQKILGIPGDEPLLLVRELGFANTAMGLLGVLSLWWPAWRQAAALVTAVFYALAGINHAVHRPRTGREWLALATDLFAAVVLGAAAGIDSRI